MKADRRVAALLAVKMGFVIASPRGMPNSKLSNTGRGRGNLPLCFYAFEFFYNLLSLLLSHSANQNLHADRHVAALLAVTNGKGLL